MTDPAATVSTPPATRADDLGQLLNGYAELPADGTLPPVPPPAAAAATGDGEGGAPPTKGRPTPKERIAAKRTLDEEYLKNEGYRYDVDDDGDIALRREGRWLTLFASDDDSDYFRFSCPNIWECESEREAKVALETVNQMNRTFKVVKFILVDGWVWANVEAYVHPLDTFRGSFDRCADLLCETTAEFRRRMKKAMAEAPRPAPPADPQAEFPYDDGQEDEPR